jgi:hypothetical protein
VKEQLIENSALVVAHPDDEILWFPFSMGKVGKIVFSFIDCPSNPQWSIGRKQVMTEYPLRNLISLDLPESEVFNKIDWNNPEIGDYGVKFNAKTNAAQNYEKNFFQLKKKLAQNLQGFKRVITHNPWGEYGNEEHVQVYRVVKTLQSELGFDIWFSNYFSTKSFSLFSRYLGQLDENVLINPIDQNLIKSIKAIYEKNKCWTWYENWEWENDEILIREASGDLKKQMFGYSIPLNMIKVPCQEERKTFKTKFLLWLRSMKIFNLFTILSQKK